MFSRFLSAVFLFLAGFSGVYSHADSTFSAAASNGFASQQQEFLTVDQAYRAELMFSNGQWQVIWQLADNYFLYRHGFNNEWLIDGNVSAITGTLPDGIKRTDEYFGDVEIYYRQVILPLAPPTPAGKALLFKATSQGCADAGLCYPPYSLYFSVDPQTQTALPISAADYNLAAGKSPATSASSRNTGDNSPLLWILFSALLGGMILNLMPCVLPVLSIKMMQLARHPDSRQARHESLAYLAGVILSFVIVAGLMLLLRASGNAIGWGFQLQNPWFIAGLVYLFFTLGLSMSGIVTFGHRWMGMGQSLTDKGGLSGAFFTGVLAVLVASPCTAPFMSAALGYAVTQSAAVALLVFAVLGLGMALPLTLVSFIPAASRYLPKPGLWMEQLKQLLAFPLYATAIWLLWVFGNQTSTQGMATLLSGCLLMALGFWCLKGASLFSRGTGVLAVLLAILLPVLLDTEKPAKTQQAGYETFSQARLQELRQQGKAVFIDLTADWCITCIANEKSTLETDAVQQAFRTAGIVYMVGDWTDYNPEITALLAEYHRSGIPLYLLFPGKPDAPAIILPQLLTPSIVLEHIEKIDSER